MMTFQLPILPVAPPALRRTSPNIKQSAWKIAPPYVRKQDTACIPKDMQYILTCQLDYAYSNPQQSAVALESVFQVIHMMRYKYEVNFHANTMIQLETILDETIQQVLYYSETAEDSSYKRTLIMNSIMACKKLINNMKTI
jgi:hypothetical protein